MSPEKIEIIIDWRAGTVELHAVVTSRGLPILRGLLAEVAEDLADHAELQAAKVAA